MSESFCSREEDVVVAVRSGEWREELRRHVASCSMCAEVQQVSRWMTGVAERMSREGIVPDPTVVWLKAQLEERQRREAAAIRKAALRKVPARFVGWLAVSMAAAWIWPYLISATAATEGWVSLVLPDVSSRVVVVAFALGFMLVLCRFRGVFSHSRFSQ
jgi:hypothetical protein